jgi:hypothetical protein
LPDEKVRDMIAEELKNRNLQTIASSHERQPPVNKQGADMIPHIHWIREARKLAAQIQISRKLTERTEIILCRIKANDICLRYKYRIYFYYNAYYTKLKENILTSESLLLVLFI